MSDHAGGRRMRGTGRRLAASCLLPSGLLAALVSGCSTPGRMRWPDAPGEPPGPRTAQVGPARAGASRPTFPADIPGPSVPSGLTAGRTGRTDGGVVRAADASEPDPTGNPAPSLPPPAGEYPIDLTTALRLAEIENPRIAEARQRIGEALALQQQADILLLPHLNAGTNFHGHTGDLQRSSGRILSLNERSLYVGGGAGAIAASPVEIPAVNLVSQLTEAIFEPLAARQQVEATRFNASATANKILLEVAELHFDLLAAGADLKVRRESSAQEAEVARLTRAYAEAQQGRAADAERSRTELSLIEIEIRQAEEDVAVASARLARRLHLDQTIRVRPVAPVVETLRLVDPNMPVPGLIQVALRLRPEVAARSAAVAVAETRYREERYRPLLPTIQVGFSGGAFGGGSNLATPTLGNFRGRTDFDVLAFWTLRNFGAGNVALQDRRWAEVGQAVAARSRVIAEVRSEVSAAASEAVAARQQVAVTTRQLASAQVGFREDLERIRNTVGRPIEVVNSLRLLNEARVDRIRAVTEANKAELRLFVALGSPPPLGTTAASPLPPAPIATPPLPPLAEGPARPSGAGSAARPPAIAARNVP